MKFIDFIYQKETERLIKETFLDGFVLYIFSEKKKNRNTKIFKSLFLKLEPEED